MCGTHWGGGRVAELHYRRPPRRLRDSERRPADICLQLCRHRVRRPFCPWIIRPDVPVAQALRQHPSQNVGKLQSSLRGRGPGILGITAHLRASVSVSSGVAFSRSSHFMFKICCDLSRHHLRTPADTKRPNCVLPCAATCTTPCVSSLSSRIRNECDLSL